MVGPLLAILAACGPTPVSAGEGSPGEPVTLGTPAARPPIDHGAVAGRGRPIELNAAPDRTVQAAPTGPAELVVDCGAQRMSLLRGGRVQRSWPVSTSRVGLGSRAGSNRTPLGRHRVAQKLGQGAPLGAVFRARRFTGKIATIHRDDTDVEEDLVLTRILWLEGLEPGVNRGRGVDSHERFIYVHGTNEEGLIGRPASHGCVRMLNRDVIELFDLVAVGTPVMIRG